MDKSFNEFIDTNEKLINPNEFGGLLLDSEEISAVSNVISNKNIFRYADNTKTSVDIFEEEIQQLYNTRYSLALNNGTSALRAALFAIGIKENDRVLVSSYTFIASAAAVISLKAIPVPIDFDYYHCLNIEHLKEEIKKGCKAIIAVHLQGRAFNLDMILELAKHNNIPVIEDACQAFGAKLMDKFVGTFGDIGVFSFQQNKQITSGEGGLLITDNQKYYNIAKNFSDHGAQREILPSWDTEQSVIGDNLRMTNIQAAILLVQLKKLDYIKNSQLRSRTAIISKINEYEIKYFLHEGFSDEQYEGTGMNIFFIAKSQQSGDLAIELAQDRNILIRRLWARPFYKHRVFDRILYNLDKNKCKASEEVSKLLLSLPIPPGMSDNYIERISETLNEINKMNYIKGWF